MWAPLFLLPSIEKMAAAFIPVINDCGLYLIYCLCDLYSLCAGITIYSFSFMIASFKEKNCLMFVWVILPIFFPRTMKVRKVEKVVLSVEQSEGVGARVRRSIGRREVSSYGSYYLKTFQLIWLWCTSDFQLRNVDPFLLLDEFRVTKPAGFPDHPHRGFETASTLFWISVPWKEKPLILLMALMKLIPPIELTITISQPTTMMTPKYEFEAVIISFIS